MEHGSSVEELVKVLLMRRVISWLMMVVMVLAPCAVAHAASSASHHAPVNLTTSHVEQVAFGDAALSGSHEQKTECLSDDRNPDHSTCSSNCDLLQRVTLQDTSDRVWADFKTIASLQIDSVLALEPQPALWPRPRPPERIQGSKTILRKTARLRL